MPLSTTTSASQGREPLVLAEEDLLDLSLGVEAALPAALTLLAAQGLIEQRGGALEGL
jgi:hypothetical protein